MVKKLSSYLDIEGAPCGNQRWWGAKTNGQHFGCGVIAGIDGLIYRGIVGSTNVSRDIYMTLAEEMWLEMKPNTGAEFHMPKESYKGQVGIGVYSLRRFRKGIEGYMQNNGHNITFYQMTNCPWLDPFRGENNFAKALDFIEGNLRKKQPVHLLSWKDQGNAYQYHWVTIVGIKTYNLKSEATIMTWGTQAVIDDFECFWKKRKFFDRKAMITYRVH